GQLDQSRDPHRQCRRAVGVGVDAMSEFFRALERAERERARRSEPKQQAPAPAEPPVDVASADSPAVMAEAIIHETAPVVAVATAVEEPRVAATEPTPMITMAEPERPKPSQPLTVAIGKASGTRPTGEI